MTEAMHFDHNGRTIPPFTANNSRLPHRRSRNLSGPTEAELQYRSHTRKWADAADKQVRLSKLRQGDTNRLIDPIYPWSPRHQQHHNTRHDWSGVSRVHNYWIPRKEEIRSQSNQLNRDQKDYAKGKLDIEAFTNSMIALLEIGNSSERVMEFMTVYREQIETNTLHWKGRKFSSCLQDFFKGFRDDTSVTPQRPASTQEQVEEETALTANENPTLAGIKYANNKARVIQSYKDYMAGAPLAEHNLYLAVRDLAKSKMRSGMYGMREGASDADDHAQEAVWSVCRSLHKFKGEPEAFYPWVNKICFNQRNDAVAENIKDFEGRVELFVEMKDGEGFGTGEYEDNPKLYESELRPILRRELPEWIQGLDLRICQYIREGYNYKLIGRITEVGEAAVEKRVARMRERIQKDRAALPQ